MDENMNLSVVTPFGIKPVSSLSHGTIDQIYLAARFALTDVFMIQMRILYHSLLMMVLLHRMMQGLYQH